MTDQPTRAQRIRAALASPGPADGLQLLVAAILITLAVGAVDWRAGIFVAGALLLADVIIGRLPPRTLP